MFKLTDRNRLSLRFPELVKQWHPTKNGSLTPSDVSYGSHKKVWWVCINGHNWLDTVLHRTNGRGCPYCSGKKVCEDNCLATLRPDLAKEWHPTKNGKLIPNDVTSSSHKKVWWQCEKGHEWKALIYNRSKTVNPARCPYCFNKKVCDDSCLATLRPDLIIQWDFVKNGSLSPRKCFKSSTKKVWWLCERGHGWEAQIKERVKGSGCPYCSGQRVCEDNCLATLRKSIASEWHPTKNGQLTPNGVACGSHKKVWWLCERCGNTWKTTVANRTHLYHCCPKCYTGPRSKIGDKWLDSLNIPLENREILLPDLKIRVDAFVPETNTVYEFFGDYWHGNPEIYDKNQEHPVVGKTFGQLYDETKARISRLKGAGYKVVYVWENDF